MKKFINTIIFLIFSLALLASVTKNTFIEKSNIALSPSIPIPSTSSTNLATEGQEDTKLASMDIKSN